MSGRKSPLSHRGAQRLGERERELGLDPDDEAARWLAEHEATPEPDPPTTSKSARKSKLLHQWGQRQQRGDG